MYRYIMHIIYRYLFVADPCISPRGCHGGLLEAYQRERGRVKEKGERNVPPLPDSRATPWGKRGMELGTVRVATNA